MDALFGLPRKKAAGMSHREANHGHLFFGDQRSVDEYVSASAPIKISKVLSDVLIIVHEVLCAKVLQ